ncbi:class E sortase [Streptomyces griseoruber]|uniref:Sortase n=1 Tax=Streptomyces griseoruber TaxID=1943 RepID=A0A101SXN7_9ACTN|nr:class E sortase [Streptomyces griseoruber]KUN81833.1 sortase [Streptomyces griseoruber]
MSLRVIVRTFSELCITVGAVIVLFVVYALFWTGVRADRAMGDQIDDLHEQWATRQPAPRASTPAPPTPYRNGQPFAVMYIPRLGFTWNKPVLEGTGTGTLKKGLGHYTGTARLGQPGNFSVAGHRRTYGDPFKDFPRLRRGDAVVLTDGTTWFTYRIDKGPYKTVPSDVEVIDAVPRKSGYTRPGRYLTLTTCDPEWGHSHRLIVWAHLDSTQPVEAGEPKALRR